jgi:hypothetical protein
MSVHLSPFPSQRAVLALTALTCLAGPVLTTAALAQQPDPAPLWKAYPLSNSKGAKPAANPADPLPLPNTARSSAPPAGPRASHHASPPLGVAIAFYGALAGLAAVVVGGATLRVVRRRAKPVVCEISWSPGEDGDAFCATAQLGDDEQWLVARSRRFERRSPEPPDYDAASQAAYDQLVRDLYADGWLPYERGREWWAMRLRRDVTSETPTSTRHR